MSTTAPDFDGIRCPMCGADNTLQAGPSIREHVTGLPATTYRPRATPGHTTYRADVLCAHCGHTWHATIRP